MLGRFTTEGCTADGTNTVSNPLAFLARKLLRIQTNDDMNLLAGMNLLATIDPRELLQGHIPPIIEDFNLGPWIVRDNPAQREQWTRDFMQHVEHPWVQEFLQHRPEHHWVQEFENSAHVIQPSQRIKALSKQLASEKSRFSPGELFEKYIKTKHPDEVSGQTIDLLGLTDEFMNATTTQQQAAILARMPDLLYDGENLLEYALDANIAQMLINKGVNVDERYEQDDSGETPLFKAILKDNIEMAKILIKNGADIFNTNYENINPLTIVSSLEMAQLLIDAGFDVSITDDRGNTLLHHAEGLNMRVPMTKLLILNGADVNARNENGNTPLHMQFSYDIIKALIEAGADPNAINSRGETPIDIAIRNDYGPDVLRLLQSKTKAKLFGKQSKKRTKSKRSKRSKYSKRKK